MMRMRFALAPALVFALALSAAPALAQHHTFTIVPDVSQVSFTLEGTGHETDGTFHVQNGKIDFDPTAGTISGLVDVAAGSGNTGNSSRDKKMLNDVLQAAKFNEVTFEPKSYSGKISMSGISKIAVTGIFTLHGTPHEITVPMEITIDGEGCMAKGTFAVPYVQWGLKDPSIFILKVAKEVNVTLTLKGKLSE
jgi:polyisoprenoid-binding protein YceI